MSADFSQFEEGDTIRVTYEGKWNGTCMVLSSAQGYERRHYKEGSLKHAKSAELVEREIKPFHEGDVVLFGTEVRRRDADGKWVGPDGLSGAGSDRSAHSMIKDGAYKPVVLHGKPVQRVEVSSRG